jgi:LmbE family N-acetylglucosaminyl deacetylase
MIGRQHRSSLSAYPVKRRVALRNASAAVFNPARPGTDEAVWRERLECEERWCPRAGPLLIVSPYPDDEVLGAGGLLRVWVELGYQVTLLSVTDGKAAYPDWTGLDGVRRGELNRALAILSPRPIEVVNLGLPDGNVSSKKVELISALRRLCENAPTLIAPFESDGHPDHEAVAVACLSVARVLRLPIARYPIWAWHHRQPSTFCAKRWGRFPLDTQTQTAKLAAMNCFVSQLAPGQSRPPIVPQHVLEYFKRDFEAFLI